MEHRKSKIKRGRRQSDIPVVALEQFKDEMKVHVTDTIERVVNGKIRDIDTKLTNYIKEDEDWKEEARPAIRNMTNLTNSSKLIIAISVGVTAVGGAILILKKFINL